MAQYKPFTRTMAGMLRNEDDLLTSGNFPSARTKAWMQRREELDLKREAMKLGQHDKFQLIWEDDRTLWWEFFGGEHGDFPGLSKHEFFELLQEPEPELKPVEKHEAYRIFGPRQRQREDGIEVEGAMESQGIWEQKKAAEVWEREWAAIMEAEKWKENTWEAEKEKSNVPQGNADFGGGQSN